MRKTTLILGTHNHLPLGLGQAAAEESYQGSLKPFLSVMYRYPEFPVTLHYSGNLLEWLEEYHPEFLTLLAEMVSRGQVEVLGGGYYDPILTLIPTNDKLGQLEKMTTWLRVRFETRPRGCWIAENVWEPSLASVLRASGIDYTFVDEGQFRIAGVPEAALWHAFLTEDQGKIISLFPLSEGLAAIARDASPADAIQFLRGDSRESVGEGGAVAVHLIDGTAAARSLLQGSWLEQFIRLAAENADWLEPGTPGQYLKENPPTRRLYIPSSSSTEMMSWALPQDRRDVYDETRRRCDGPGNAAQFVVGGQFRQFLLRYPEAWLMYAKMMNTHVLVSQVRGDKYKKKAAQNELWKGQSHHAYWHNGSGGIYDNGLRKAVYHSLIEAEKITRATEIFAPSIISVDFDMDNSIEYLYQGSELNAYIHSRGGAMFELDFLPASWNYLDTMVDREEECSEDGASSVGEGQPCAYQRKAFIDHFFTDGCALGDFERGRHSEAGDFVSGLYELVDLNRALPELLMRRTGSISSGGVPQPAAIEKRFVFRPRSIDVYYKVSNLGPDQLSARFGVEINLSLAARSADCGRLFLLDEDRKKEIESGATEIEGVKGLLVRDVRNEVSVTLSSAREFRCWSIPVETLSSDAAPESRAFQSHCFVPQWDLRLGVGEAWENHMSVGFEKTQSP